MLKGVQDQMDKLSVQLLDALHGKANCEDLQKMLSQQQTLEGSLRRLMRAQSPVASRHDESTTEDPACIKKPLIPARCISCDRIVEFTPGKPHPCHASCPSW